MAEVEVLTRLTQYNGLCYLGYSVLFALPFFVDYIMQPWDSATLIADIHLTTPFRCDLRPYSWARCEEHYMHEKLGYYHKYSEFHSERENTIVSYKSAALRTIMHSLQCVRR